MPRYFLRRLGMDDVTMHIILQILTPFVIYLAAEEIGVSGILAVVAGGVTHAIEQDRMEANLAKLQIASSNTWNIILFILNGLVFVLLGLQIPDVSTVIFQDESFNNMQVIGYILIITLCLMVLRPRGCDISRCFLYPIYARGRITISRAALDYFPRSRRDLMYTHFS